mmetsp:Transcript_26448/g.26698  ORF Transcript_26448/g.26698 Transcript_26448/m.26698 type:complete len:176 (-) Transcript_26448:139-666(-)
MKSLQLLLSMFFIFTRGISAAKSTSRNAGRPIYNAPTPPEITASNVILYDGLCNFCNRWVDLLMKLDVKNKFTYSALQSEFGKDILTAIGKEREDISSVILFKSLDEYYSKSDVVLKVIEEFGMPTRLVSVTVPRKLRDGLYDLVANNRYNFLGKRDTCRCSDPRYPEKFLNKPK